MFVDVAPERMTAYTDAMAKGMADKLFFVPHLPPGAALLDFGCADGRLLQVLGQMRPDLLLAGLDCSPPALARAKAAGITHLFSAPQQARPWISKVAHTRPVFLLASSVLHEVAHYGGSQGWAEFWDFANTSDLYGIAVRDFSLDADDAKAEGGEFARAVRAGLPGWQRDNFERLWGPITTQGRAVHAALKAPWVNSWDREGPENYFPIWRHDLEKAIKNHFTPVSWRPHIHPYTDTQTRSRFGVGLPCPTHISLVALRKN